MIARDSRVFRAKSRGRLTPVRFSVISADFHYAIRPSLGTGALVAEV